LWGPSSGLHSCSCCCIGKHHVQSHHRYALPAHGLCQPDAGVLGLSRAQGETEPTHQGCMARRTRGLGAGAELGMPTLGKAGCSAWPCPLPAVYKGRCRTHAGAKEQQQRGTSLERGYDSAWAAYSLRFRAAHPLCGERADGTKDKVHSQCVQQGRETPAECVDHTVPMSQGGSKWDESNHMSACLACNTWKQATLERKR
jgi:5-methylcytosine-specific restriction endonuclease McrA